MAAENCARVPVVEFFLLAAALGIKHSFDADHLVAVSNFLGRAASLGHSARMAVSWGAGHAITAASVTAALFSFREPLLPLVLGKMELLAAIMLVLVGIFGIFNSRLLHAHEHVHGRKEHTHWHIHFRQTETDHSHLHMFGIGVLQGLASNDELLLLLTVSLGLSSILEMAIGAAMFSLGVVIGMVAYSILFVYPILKIESWKLASAVNFAASCVSIIYGLKMIFWQ